jgi:desulfoferrodoxin-like iron-binding protein
MAKKGEQYKCDECGLIVEVADPCGCSACDIICCGAPMKPVKAAKTAPKAKKK